MDVDSVRSSFENNLISFSHDVYKEIPSVKSECVSPYSIISALLMLMVGTRGTSKSQIQSAILKGSWDDEVIYKNYQSLNGKVFNSTEHELSIATKLFIREGLRVTKNVRDVAKTYFNAAIGQTDFSNKIQATKDINDYVAKWTKNRITDFVSKDKLSSATVMFLVNAVYFKGVWETEFDPINTRNEDFLLTESEKMKVDFMTMTHSVYFVSENDYSAISLPYTGKQYEMVFILPKRIDGLNDLKRSFSQTMASEIESKLALTRTLIKIPKFTFKSKTDLKDLLKKLDILDIFEPGVANLSNFIQNSDMSLVVSDARHEVFIEVNEMGTEAAGVTGIGVVGLTSVLTPPSFIANHPFLFYIKHRPSGTILFIGHYIAS